jgi:hypothetical protein
MEDLRTLWRILGRHKGKLLVVLALAGVLFFLVSGAKLEFVSVSPDRTYRLEYYSARHYQRLMNWSMELPSFVRLYRNADNKYFGESTVADFFGGNDRSLWLIDEAGEVAVGRDISFTGIPPITASGDILSVPQTKAKNPHRRTRRRCQSWRGKPPR